MRSDQVRPRPENVNHRWHGTAQELQELIQSFDSSIKALLTVN